MHSSTIYVFFLLLSYDMFQHIRHLQGGYTNISLKYIAIIILQKKIVNMQVLLKIVIYKI